MSLGRVIARRALCASPPLAPLRRASTAPDPIHASSPSSVPNLTQNQLYLLTVIENVRETQNAKLLAVERDLQRLSHMVNKALISYRTEKIQCFHDALITNWRVVFSLTVTGVLHVHQVLARAG